jgi:hypothetical protein
VRAKLKKVGKVLRVIPALEDGGNIQRAHSHSTTETNQVMLVVYLHSRHRAGEEREKGSPGIASLSVERESDRER